jgi:hypothetical protein
MGEDGLLGFRRRFWDGKGDAARGFEGVRDDVAHDDGWRGGGGAGWWRDCGYGVRAAGVSPECGDGAEDPGSVPYGGDGDLQAAGDASGGVLGGDGWAGAAAGRWRDADLYFAAQEPTGGDGRVGEVQGRSRVGGSEGRDGEEWSVCGFARTHIYDADGFFSEGLRGRE